MSTSALPLSRSATAVATARGHVAEQLARHGLAWLAPDAELAVSELVTNALLHTRGDLSVCVRPTARGVRVEVADESPTAPTPGLLQRTGMSGRGLLLVAQVTAGWGSGPTERGKVVWFEMRADQVRSSAEYTVDDLLTMWDYDDEPAPHGGDYVGARDVALPGLTTAQLVEVKARTDDLGREMALIVSQPDGRPEHLLEVARRLDQLMHELAPLRTAIRAQAMAAANRGEPRLDLQLRVAVDDAARVEAYADALDAADELARAGELLTVPSSERIAAFRRAYLREIAAQAWGRSAPAAGPASGAGLAARMGRR